MNRCLCLAKSQDYEPNLSFYHKDGWYTTFSFYICMRNYGSGAKTRSFDKRQLAMSQIKDRRFDRIGRPQRPARESHINLHDLLLRFYGKYASQNSQGLIRAASCSLFPETCLVRMLTQFAKGLDLVALVSSNDGHNWCFQRTLAWMMDCLPSRAL